VPETKEAAGEEEDDSSTPANMLTAPHGRPALSKEPCADSLDQCSLDGCENAGTPHALLNHYKRRTTDAKGDAITFESAVPITISNMVNLQTRVEMVVPKPKAHQELTAVQRDRLKIVGVDGLTLGEGIAVRVAGYVAPTVRGSKSAGAHEGGAESVNCRVAKPSNAPSWTVHDFHIPITERPISSSDPATECDGIVVEMVPQHRVDHPGWSLEVLRKAAREQQLVMFVGPLFYDNEHVPNPDCSHLVASQPKRASLWELHPVIEFYVCTSGRSCKASSKTGWQRVD
jgi:hypothetical protein